MRILITLLIIFSNSFIFSQRSNLGIVFGTSFYINNSSYKNTISSGSFSNISNIDLKRNISNYYEVYGAKLYDNNKLIDDVAEYYTVNTLPKPGGIIADIIEKTDSKKVEILKKYYKTMPRTMLRYAIEKFLEEKRQKYLAKKAKAPPVGL